MKSATAEEGVYLDQPPSRDDLRAAAMQNPTILSLPVSITVAVGAARLTIDELLALTPQSILPLDAAIDDPVNLMVGDRVIATGALVETDGDRPGLGVRIISVAGERDP